MDAKKYAAKSFLNVEYIERHGPVEGVIEHVELGQYDKLVITLSAGHKFSLNKTNVGILCRDLGENTDDWLGHPVHLVVGEIKFQGNMQKAVVVEPLISNEGEEARPKSKKPKTDYDDQIPF